MNNKFEPRAATTMLAVEGENDDDADDEDEDALLRLRSHRCGTAIGASHLPR